MKIQTKKGSKLIIEYNKPSQRIKGWSAWFLDWYSFPKSSKGLGSSKRYRGLILFGFEFTNYEE